MKIDYKINNYIHRVYFNNKVSSLITRDIEKIKSDRKLLIIYDENIDKSFVDEIILSLKLIGSKVVVAEVNGSKTKKNEKLLFKIINILIEKKFTKKSILISLGGGVIGDVTALAASLYLRGMIYFNIPTTMTSIIDSCLGGKTAINYKNITNSVGSYYHSHRVYISQDVIKKLPQREYVAGIPEILKCSLIYRNNKFFKFLISNKEKILKRDYKIVKKICYETLKIKLSFFLNDVFEKKNRLYLNFGHTFAHAIEMATDREKKDFYRHGEAVGLGILCELYYANKMKNTLYKQVEAFLNFFNLPSKIKSDKFIATKLHTNVYKYLFLDKKKIGKNPRYIFLKTQGKPKIKDLEDSTLINETIYNIIAKNL